MVRIFGACLMFVLLGSFASALVHTRCNSHSQCEDHELCIFSFSGPEKEHRNEVGICASGLSESTDELVGFSNLETDESAPASGGGSVTSFAVKAPDGFASSVVLGSPKDKAFGIGVDKSKSFYIGQGDNKYVTIDDKGDIVMRTNKLEAASFDVEDAYVVGDVRQWSLVVAEKFAVDKAKTAPKGWEMGTKKVTEIAATECAGVSMLGGFEKFSGGEVRKAFPKLMKHTQVRIQATFHCIDLWNGETGYMMLNNGLAGEMEYAWTKTYTPPTSTAPRNVCGIANYGEGSFSNLIDVTVPHTGDTLKILFGSTLDASAAAYWGISNLNIYVR